MKALLIGLVLLLPGCGETDFREGDMLFVDDGTNRCGEWVTQDVESVFIQDATSGDLFSAPWDAVVKVPSC